MKLRLFAAAFALALGTQSARADKIDPAVAGRARAGQSVEVLIRLNGDAELTGISLLKGQRQRGAETVRRLMLSADSSQGALRAWLDVNGVEHRDFWLVNAIAARLTPAQLARVAQMAEVTAIADDPVVRRKAPLPDFAAQAKAASAVGWNISIIHAPEVWAQGITGQGVTVAGADTGYQWDHPALKTHYRGWNGATASHAYNWHDAIHADISGNDGNPCGFDSSAPCDDDSHGTHTMGSMVGDDGAGNQIGVAPGAKWMGCRNMEENNGRPSTYIECFQFFVAPTDAANANADPSRAPQVINNSWYCPPAENCDAAATELMRQTIVATTSAGILVVVAAGNMGPSCNTVMYPPEYFSESFAVGATDAADEIAVFSSRGPVTVDGSNRLKPDISAPGEMLVSSVPPNSYGAKHGTSMASPHIVGSAALMLSAAPGLKGDPAAIRQSMTATARGLTSTQNCGTYPGTQIPNAVFGAGRADALAAVGAVGRIFADQFE
jgi:subtilisin family serine protease